MSMQSGLMSSELWMRELEDASRLADEVAEMISQKSSLPPSGMQTQRHMSTARRKMTILRTKLETLQSIWSETPIKQIMTLKEVKRREEMLNNLTLKAGELAPTLNMSIAPDRANLLGLGRTTEEVMKKAEQLDNHGIVSLQRQIIKEQDEGLAQLEETIASTKHIALAVNEELDLHTRLLDDLDDDVDTTNSRLQRVQRKLALLKRNTKGGCSCLILLVLIVVVLLFAAFKLLKYL